MLAGCCLRGRQWYSRLVTVMGVIGVVATAFPRQHLDWGSRVAYRNPEDIEWTDWFPTAVRGLGVLSVLQ